MRLSISLVIYYPKLGLLQQTLSSLSTAIAHAVDSGQLDQAALFLINNSRNCNRTELKTLLDNSWRYPVEWITPPTNLGFGRGHNLTPDDALGDWHLVINPDVSIAEDALSVALDYLRQHPEVGLLTPLSQRASGAREYLVKRYPSIWLLFLRGFAPGWLKRRFDDQLSHYECREMTETNNQVEIASGCFMLLRRAAWRATQGFSSEFFMYFEDFDLSLRLRQEGWQIAFNANVKIRHHGGHSAHKGLRHIGYFGVSALRFFSRHGWRWT